MALSKRATCSMEKSLKLLVISNLYPPQVVGGYERAIADYTEQLSSRGHSVLVITSNTEGLSTSYPSTKQYIPTIKRCLSLCATIVNGGIQWLPPDRAEAIMLENCNSLSHELSQFQPNVCLLGNVEFLNIDLIEQVLDAGIPVVHYVMNAHPGYPNELAPKHPLFRYITISNWVQQNLRDNGYLCETAQTIYPGVNIDEFYQEILPPRDCLCIAYASLVMPYKGADVLLESLSILNMMGIEFTATFAGGSLEPLFVERLKEFAKSEGIDDKISFMGVLSRTELIQLYKTHNVLVFPSRYQEPFGISQIESMMAGLVTITSGTGGASEAVIHGETGFIFESENSLDLAEILHWLHMNPAEWEAIACNGQKSAVSNFNQSSTVEKLESILHLLHNQRLG